jgi:pimeloyl-ACP methyl ester carboxylesterase
MKNRPLMWAALMLALVLAGCANTSTQAQAPDPAIADPVVFDKDFPAALLPFTVVSGGETLNGRGLLAQGQGPHPTVLLLHGLPGNELNLDMAQAIRRAGWNVFTIHYRGNWGSGGEYSFPHVLEDTSTVLAYLRSKAADPKWRIDATKIVLIGHSVGGFAALQVGAVDAQVRSIASVSGFDLGVAGEIIAAQPQARQGWANFFKSTASLRIGDVDAFMVGWSAQAAAWKFTALTDRLAKKNVLLVVATRDVTAVPALNHVPLVQALKTAAAANFTEVSIDSDHSYSDRRIALSRAVLVWLEKQR